MVDFLDAKRREIDARLKELKPYVVEYERLMAASAALKGLSPAPAAVTSRRARTPAAKADPPRRAAQGARRRGRPKGSGTRGIEALLLVKARPGITVAEIAEQMGIKQNYLYRVLPALVKEGLITKQGRGWHPIGAA